MVTTVQGPAIRKSRLMRDAEEYLGEPLESVLPKMFNDYGLIGSSERLHVSKATLWYWYMKLGIRLLHVALAPGQRIEIVEAGS